MQLIFFFSCSFNDVKHGFYVNHLLFTSDRDVEGDGAHPFQCLRIPSALVPPQWQKDKLICRVWNAVLCGLKDPPHLYRASSSKGVCAGRSRMVKVCPSVGWSCFPLWLVYLGCSRYSPYVPHGRFHFFFRKRDELVCETRRKQPSCLLMLCAGVPMCTARPC